MRVRQRFTNDKNTTSQSTSELTGNDLAELNVSQLLFEPITIWVSFTRYFPTFSLLFTVTGD